MMRASDMSGNLFSLLLPLLLLLLLLSTSCAASKADDGKQQYPAGPSATDAVQQESDCCTHRSAHHKGINWKTRQLCSPPLIVYWKWVHQRSDSLVHPTRVHILLKTGAHVCWTQGRLRVASQLCCTDASGAWCCERAFSRVEGKHEL